MKLIATETGYAGFGRYLVNGELEEALNFRTTPRSSTGVYDVHKVATRPDMFKSWGSV